jgi:hypothetical protein
MSMESMARIRFNGEPLDKLIPRLLDEEGTVHGAAVRLGVYPNAIRQWARREGLEFAHAVKLVPASGRNEARESDFGGR